ncbi:MAG: hypothetical protein ACREIU_02510 [Planctomycetota bacterium]
MRASLLAAFVGVAVVCGASAASGTGGDGTWRRTFLDALPLSFVPNQGQAPGDALFVARRGGARIHAARDGVTLQWVRRTETGDPEIHGGPGSEDRPRRVRGVNLRLAFEGAKASGVEGRDPLPGRFNYFFGNDPSEWRVGLPSFARVVYDDLLPGVDLVLREERGGLEYDLLLDPGAAAETIVVRVEGTNGPLKIDGEGALRIPTELGVVVQPPPVAWEEGSSGIRLPAECSYRLLDDRRFAFGVRGRNPSARLVIDPALVYSTFVGETYGGTAVSRDSSGAPTVAGTTIFDIYPTTPGAFDATWNGGSDVFVTRLTPAGDALVYSTFLGGTGEDLAFAIAVDGSGAATVVGKTSSVAFPTTSGAYDSTHNGGPGTGWDGFVTRLSPAGDALLYSTFLGGTATDDVKDVAVDPTGAATVAWNNYSGLLPHVRVARISPSGSALLSSTLLAGSMYEEVEALALDPAGAAYVTGRTLSTDFPTTPGAYDSTFAFSGLGGYGDAFVSKVSPGGSVVYSTYLGGLGYDWGFAIDVDASGSATVGGFAGQVFPTTAGAFDTTDNGPYTQTGFVTRFSPSGGTLLFSTYLGGSEGLADAVYTIALDASGAATVAGYASSSDFPITPGAFDTTLDAVSSYSSDGFVSRLSPSGTKLLYSTFLGGGDNDSIQDLAPDGLGGVVSVGYSYSPDYPTTPGAFDTVFSFHPGTYYGEAFVTRLSLQPAGVSPYGAASPGCSGASTMGVTSNPSVGNPAFGITCSGAPANASGWLLLSADPDAGGTPLVGLTLWIDVASPTCFALSAASGALGWTEVPIPVPSSLYLAGSQAFAQFVWPDPCGPALFSASNALEVVVQP